jgi:hypothetical protein
MQLPLPGTAEGSGDEVALVAAPGDDVAAPEAGEAAFAATGADPGAAARGIDAGVDVVDALHGDDEPDDADGGDESLGVRIEATALDDDGADGDADPDEREASGLEATGLVAAPPARDD